MLVIYKSNTSTYNNNNSKHTIYMYSLHILASYSTTSSRTPMLGKILDGSIFFLICFFPFRINFKCKQLKEINK